MSNAYGGAAACHWARAVPLPSPACSMLSGGIWHCPAQGSPGEGGGGGTHLVLNQTHSQMTTHNQVTASKNVFYMSAPRSGLPLAGSKAFGRALHSNAKNIKGGGTKYNITVRCSFDAGRHLIVLLHLVQQPLLFFATLCSALPTAGRAPIGCR